MNKLGDPNNKGGTRQKLKKISGGGNYYLEPESTCVGA